MHNWAAHGIVGNMESLESLESVESVESLDSPDSPDSVDSVDSSLGQFCQTTRFEGSGKRKEKLRMETWNHLVGQKLKKIFFNE